MLLCSGAKQTTQSASPDLVVSAATPLEGAGKLRPAAGQITRCCGCSTYKHVRTSKSLFLCSVSPLSHKLAALQDKACCCKPGAGAGAGSGFTAD